MTRDRPALLSTTSTRKNYLLRNIDHFAFLRRHTEVPQMEEFHFPIRGPRFIIPPPKPL